MAASRLVMIDWGEEYSSALKKSRMEIGLLSGYVDDIRQVGTSIRLGLRYVKLKWRWSEDQYQEDLEMRSKGESRDKRMIRICLPVANQINKDIEFTAEAAEEVENQRLPTLDFELWLEGDHIDHHYFKKKDENTGRGDETFVNSTTAKTLHPLKRSHQEAVQQQPQEAGEGGDQDSGGAVYKRAEGVRVHQDGG